MRTPAVVAAALLSMLATSMGSSPASAVKGPPAPEYREYVALGDSWTADVFATFPPTTEFVPIDCAQSDRDYPHQVARALGITTFRDASCGSATTEHMTQPQPLPLGGVNAPQFDRLTATTDLVTVGIGGNDIGLAGVTECLNLMPINLLGLPAPLGTPCGDRFTAGGVDRFAEAIKATSPKLERVIEEIRERSPKARIFLVNYLNGLPADGRGCWPVVPITDGDMAYLQKTFLAMNEMLRAVAEDTRATLIDTYTPTLGHDMCQPPGRRYAEGLVPLGVSNPLLLAFPFHPNAAGADAQSIIVAEAIRRS